MKKQKSTIKIRCRFDKELPLSELKPHPKNMNKHPEDQISRLAEVIEYQGVRHPIVVSRLSNCITKGHGRLAAAKKLGLETYPVEYQEYESEEQEYADIVADNAIAAWAELDLSMINNEIPDLGPDLDIELLGIKDLKLDPAELNENKQKETKNNTKECPECGYAW